MNHRGFVIIALIVVGVSVACIGPGQEEGRAGVQQAVPLDGVVTSATPVALRESRRIRLYWGSEIQEEPAFTIVAGRVYRGEALTNPFLTLEDRKVYSGGMDGPLLYRFDEDRVVEGYGDAQTWFVQRANKMYFGPAPEAPVLFTFEGTQVYRGDPTNSRILATSNTVFNDPDLVKLITIMLYIETLE
jgi:hypothetical protein